MLLVILNLNLINTPLLMGENHLKYEVTDSQQLVSFESWSLNGPYLVPNNIRGRL